MVGGHAWELAVRTGGQSSFTRADRARPAPVSAHPHRADPPARARRRTVGGARRVAVQAGPSRCRSTLQASSIRRQGERPWRASVHYHCGRTDPTALPPPSATQPPTPPCIWARIPPGGPRCDQADPPLPSPILHSPRQRRRARCQIEHLAPATTAASPVRGRISGHRRRQKRVSLPEAYARSAFTARRAACSRGSV